MDRSFGLRRTSAFKLSLFLGLLLLASLLSACSESRYDLGKGEAAAVKADLASAQRLCLLLPDYRGEIAPENLQAVLNICELSVDASVNGKVSAEVPIPLYTEEEKAELLQQEAADKAAFDYEEEPLDAEDDSEGGEDSAAADGAEEIGEDCGDCEHEHFFEACTDDAELDSEAAELEDETAEAEPEAALEAEESAAEDGEAEEASALVAEAVPEEEAEAQTLAAQGKSAASASSSEVGEAVPLSYDGRAHGSVRSSEAVLDENNALRIYFNIDSELFPIKLESLSLSEKSGSEDGAFLFFPLQIEAEKGGCTVEIAQRQEGGTEPAGGEAESLSSFRLIYDGEAAEETSYGKYVYFRITDLACEPTEFSLSYTEDGASEVKTVSIASYDDNMLTFGRILTDASYITLNKIEVGAASYETAKRIDLNSSAHIEVLSYYDFVLGEPIDYIFKFTKPAGSSLKLRYTAGNSSEIREALFPGSASAYNILSSENAEAGINSAADIIVLREVQVNNRYMSCSETLTNFNPEMNSRMDLFSGYSNMDRESISYCQSVSGVSSKPASCRLYYKKYGNTTEYTASGTYNSSSQTVNFRFNANDDITVTKIIVNSRIYTNSIALNCVKSSNTIKYANMPYAKLVVKNVKSAANYIVVTYKLYNSKTGVYSSSTYKKTAGTYSSADKTYTFSFTPSALNGIDYDTAVIKSVTLDNSVSVKDRSIAMGKTYGLLYSGLSAQNTRYAVNVTNGTANIVGRKGTMTYTLPSGKSYTANGSVRYDPVAKRYVMHFDTVKTTAASIKVNKITVGNRYYASSFTMKYGQNKNASNPNEGRNTRTLGMGSGFKACSVAYTVTLTNASSSLSNPSMKWSTANGSYTTKGKYADGKITFAPKTSADTLTVGTITAGSKKSIKSFALTPKKRSYSLSCSSQMGKKGNKWVSQTCSACYVKGGGKCKTCKGSGKVACSAFKMAGASKCFSCSDTGKMNCPTCAATKKCQTCSGKGTRNVLKAVD